MLFEENCPRTLFVMIIFLCVCNPFMRSHEEIARLLFCGAACLCYQFFSAEGGTIRNNSKGLLSQFLML